MQFDQIGPWSEVKLEILRKYVGAYSRILAKQPGLSHVYVDAFSGAGVHVAKRTGQSVVGSPLRALEVTPPFREYYFIDLNPGKIEVLRTAVGSRSDVHIYAGDCNKILLKEIFPLIRRDPRCRGLCFLDPYGLHLRWEVIESAGQSGTIEIFLNFPIADMNRNALRRAPERVTPAQRERMNAFWGDRSWEPAAYDRSGNFFGWAERTDNRTVVAAFGKRLESVAGFSYVPDPLPMRNSKRSEVYYLFFASPNRTGAKIVSDIFRRYRDRAR